MYILLTLCIHNINSIIYNICNNIQVDILSDMHTMHEKPRRNAARTTAGEDLLCIESSIIHYCNPHEMGRRFFTIK